MNEYPEDWPAIAKRIKDTAGWKCERCQHAHEVATGYVLTVHHLDGNKANVADWNLAALCQRCHLRVQGRVKMDQGFFEELMPISPWFIPHLAGYLAATAQRPARNQSPVPSSEQCPAYAMPSGTPDRSHFVPPVPSDTPPSAPH